MKSSTIRLFCAIASMGMLLSGALANATDATISARFEPNLQDASHNQFTNTTPQAGFCQRWPETCTEYKYFSVGIDGVTYNKRAIKLASDVRDRLYAKAPASQRIRVENEAGDSFMVEFRISAISHRTENNPAPVLDNPAWSATQGGCFGWRVWAQQGNNSSYAQYIWRIKNPSAPAGCYADATAQNAGFSKNLRMSELAIGYELITPTPLSLANGLYKGQVTYRIGNNADFDFGNNVTSLSKSTINIAFELTVKHQVRVEFPPGSDRAVLEPQGGWGEWVHRGRQPTRLYRDLPFRLWSGGPFNMYLNCQYSAGNNCAIRNQNNRQVPINVAVTLPSHVALANGGTVRRESLPVGSAAAKRFRSVSIGLNQPAQLHFEASQAAVNDMLKQPGSTYQGDVTIIFDAEM